MPEQPVPKLVIVPQQQPKAPNAAFIVLAGLIGAGTATAVVTDTKQDEGVVYRAYPDLGAVYTICAGTTQGVKAGDVATPDQCDAMTATDLTRATNTVLGCDPNLKGHPNQLRASIRFQNNSGKFCASTGGKLMKAGKLKAGCDALLAYNGIIAAKPIKGAVSARRLSDGRYFSVIRGLQNRRLAEHKVCVVGL